ncbi:MFS transporter [Fusobacterium sp.]|uniref:MFS transporter n=1 Tax=Fusobacterium sp. TaxID=68766 RepID=UPI002612F301|nr:MFS transporter [Fusobacterium sp.]
MFETKLKKNRWNLIMFIISYTINNIISGIVYDVYINYLQDTSENLAKSFWSYYGYSAFVGAFLLLFISKIGYKKIVIFCSLACSITLIAAAYFKETYIFYISTLFILTGIQLHFSVLSPYIATYAEFKEKIKWFSRAFYIGYVGFFLSIYLGGYFVVRLFAKYIGKNFHEAKEITATVLEMNSVTKGLYIDSMGKILMISGIISLLALIPAFLIKEEKEDYIYQKKEKHKLTEIKSNLKKLMKKNTVVYLIYWGLTNFGMGLFTSYFTVFLNRVLYIDKATSSLLVSISYGAMVIFMLFTDKCVKKFGQVVTLVGTSLMAIPFMLLIAQGDRFGNNMVWVVGISLFMRAGLMNLSSPIDSSFSMEIVEPELRPIYASIINFIAGIASIVSGYFTGKYLFVNLEGYREAYYIAAEIYGVASLIFILNFMKYNRVSSEEEMR